MAEHAHSTSDRGAAPLTTRERLEAAVEAAIAALDAFDGDPDLDVACEDEGFDSDREPTFEEEGPYQPFDLDQRLPEYA